MDKSTAYCAITGSGRLHGSSYDPKYIENLPARFHSKIVLMSVKEAGIWNPVTEIFDPRPDDFLRTFKEIIKLFLESERENLFGSTDPVVKAFLGEISGDIRKIYLKDPWFLRHLAHMEDTNVIGEGRATVIGNG